MFHRLPGLPATGPLAEQFSATGLGKHREGLVVRFEPPGGSPWVGNFQPGLSDFSTVVHHPDGFHVVVIAGGQGYIVHPHSRVLIEVFGGAVEWCFAMEDPPLLVEHDGLSFSAFGVKGHLWETPRLSWDGFRHVRIEGGIITGEAWNPMGETWDVFTVHLATGKASGGSYCAW
ncbi:MAG TPA: hypothetical protein VNT75_06260 [Symbiobacteriaceae bacterium]|nr:hypothetical protein [Symbiobacteriaceae bacterium]